MVAKWSPNARLEVFRWARRPQDVLRGAKIVSMLLQEASELHKMIPKGPKMAQMIPYMTPKNASMAPKITPRSTKRFQKEPN